jgi:hypothetical protein
MIHSDEVIASVTIRSCGPTYRGKATAGQDLDSIQTEHRVLTEVSQANGLAYLDRLRTDVDERCENHLGRCSAAKSGELYPETKPDNPGRFLPKPLGSSTIASTIEFGELLKDSRPGAIRNQKVLAWPTGLWVQMTRPEGGVGAGLMGYLLSPFFFLVHPGNT